MSSTRFQKLLFLHHLLHLLWPAHIPRHTNNNWALHFVAAWRRCRDTWPARSGGPHRVGPGHQKETVRPSCNSSGTLAFIQSTDSLTLGRYTQAVHLFDIYLRLNTYNTIAILDGRNSWIWHVPKVSIDWLISVQMSGLGSVVIVCMRAWNSVSSVRQERIPSSDDTFDRSVIWSLSSTLKIIKKTVRYRRWCFPTNICR